MENYKIIKDYLQTFPEGTKVDDVINNIKKAEELYQDKIEKQKSRMSDNIGKCFYCDDIDDSVCVVKYFYKITGVKELQRWKSIDSVVFLYEAEMVQINENEVYCSDGYSFTETDLNGAKEIPNETFEEVKGLYQKLREFNV